MKEEEENRFKQAIKDKFSQAQKNGTTAKLSLREIAKDYIKMVDTDGNEMVDFEEFKDFCSLIQYKDQSEQQMRTLFDTIDDD